MTCQAICWNCFSIYNFSSKQMWVIFQLITTLHALLLFFQGVANNTNL